MFPTDQQLLRDYRAAPSPERLESLVDRYLPLVHWAALRQCPDPEIAARVTGRVFATAAHQVQKGGRVGALAVWLFDATRIAACQAGKSSPDRQARNAVHLSSGPPLPPELETWKQVEPAIDAAIARLSPKRKGPFLLRSLLNWPADDAAAILRLSRRRLERRAQKGFLKVWKRVRRRVRNLDEALLRRWLVAHAASGAIPAALRIEVLAAVSPRSNAPASELPLLQGILRGLAWLRWKRRLMLAGKLATVLVSGLACLIGAGFILINTPGVVPWLMELSIRRRTETVPELAVPARSWPEDSPPRLVRAGDLRGPADLYHTTNIWRAHLQFTADQWEAMTPKRVPRVPKLFQSDGTIVLRNPKAQRSGLAGSLGYDFVWTHGTLEFAGVTWTNVGCRYRGNGTFLHSLYGPKRPLKVELDKFEKKQALAGVRTLNLANLTVDSSYLSDALGYELFRAAGVPAPRTAYVWLTVTAAGQFARQPFGLYLLIEDLDPAFAEDRFGSKRTAIFKPVTYDLFQDLGRDWSAYERIYDPKTKLSNDQKERVIAFAQLLTHANDSEFARQVGEFLDLDEFARFLAGLVLLSSYDGFLSNGQNFYMYLDPRSEKFGFIPWDLDHAWGAFPFVGLPETREQASIWRPWSSRNRLLERVLAVGEFRRLYRDRLDDLLSHHFVPDQLNHRIDEIAQIIRAPIAAENDYRFKRFEEATSMTWNQRSHGNEDGPTAPVHQIKRFIQNRALAVRDQLDGKAKGVEFAVRGPDERR